MNNRGSFSFALAISASFVACAFAEGTLRVQVDKPGIKISPSLYGIFFEEINNAGDGGLYAEKLRNRNFEEPGSTPPFWSLVPDGARGSMTRRPNENASEFNKTHIRLTRNADAAGTVGITNDGYWGVAVEKGKTYRLTLRARSTDVKKLTASIQSKAGAAHATTDIDPTWASPAGFQMWQVELTAAATDPAARLVLGIDQPGSVDIDYVSLLPSEGLKPLTLRKDLADKLVALRPAFVRFPGGCWVEGETMASAYRWKRTLGLPWERWTQPNLWGYQSPNGLGYHEYLQLCEDLNAPAMYVANVGMSHKEVVPMNQMGPWVQDALDAIEYATGPVASTWGAKRAAAGHPEPFKLEYVEIGNENGGREYDERYALFYDAIKKAHPQVKTIACLWRGRPSSRPIEILDEHYYESPRFFFRNATRYDTYDRSGPKIYVGEYAVTKGSGAGNLISALGEAAFMTGMERNSDVVVMSSYAPLFTHVNGKRWNPDLINFDNLTSYGTPSYYVQQMFAANRGDVVLPVTITPEPIDASKVETKLAGKAGVGSWATQVEYKDFEVVSGDKVVYRGVDAKLADWSFIGKGEWQQADGTLAQTGTGTEVQAVAGDAKWRDYSVRVKARKTGGREGFLVVARYQGTGDYVWFNVGGWGNAGSGLERNHDGSKTEIGPRSDFKVEADRWYDLRLDVSGEQVTAYVDGKEIASGKDVEPGPVDMLAATASRDESSGDLIVKLVNGNATPQAFRVDLAGAKPIEGKAKLTVLAGQPADENTIDKPDHVAPKHVEVEVKGTSFTHAFAAHSVTVVRVPTR